MAGALILLGLLGAWLWAWSEPKPVPVDPTAPPAARPTTAAGPTAAVERPPSLAAVELPAPAQTPTLVRGRVVDALGGPIEAAAVLVRLPALGSATHATTDADGWFTVAQTSVQTPGWLGVAPLTWISASAPGYASSTVARYAPLDGVELTLIPESTVAGVVVSEAGDPIAGVLVELRPPPMSLLPSWPGARTDAAGRFEIHGIGPGRHTPQIEDGRWLAEHAPIDVQPLTSVDDLRLVAREGHPVSVRVLRPDGSPCPEPRAWIDGLLRRGRAGSDPGVWALAAVPAGEHEVHAACPDARAVASRVRVPTEDEITLQTEAGLSLSGRVLDDRREPVAGAQVRLVTPGHAHDLFQTDSDADGRFVLTGLAPGRFELDARHELLRPSEVLAVTLDEHAAATPELELILARGRCIAVQVRELAAPVLLRALEPPARAVQAQTDDDGAVELCGFGEEAIVELELRDPIRAVRLPVRHEPPARDGVVRLTAEQAFAGPIELALAGAPERALTVTLDDAVEALIVVSGCESCAGEPRCDVDPWPLTTLARGLTGAGKRRFDGLWPGRYLVHASFEGRRDCAIVEIDERDDATVALRIAAP